MILQFQEQSTTLNEPCRLLGIDISKAPFQVALLKGQTHSKYQQFANGEKGFGQFSQWLARP